MSSKSVHDPVLNVGPAYLQGLAVVQHSFRTGSCKVVGVHTAAMQTDLCMGVVDTYIGLRYSLLTSLKPKIIDISQKPLQCSAA